ncbi:hypothetical protein [Chryseobacterium sp. Marseille-Q3244]|uniref:hypothetical protein n=1 Tax=Chryseobacterium sp. Marseille-Q3244 TaxID=2758092 RepID=UPI0020258EE2|nr:hypothetical protein [Chryseobacterium sp. Marseille-Q3244]
MYNKIYYLGLIFCSLFYSAQDIEIIKVIYRNNLNYQSLYNKKTISYDEIDTSKNISLITKDNNLNFSSLIKCHENKCFTMSIDDIIVSSDFILSGDLNIKGQLVSMKNYTKDYLNRLVINQKKLKKKSSYILYQNELKNVIIVVLQMTKSYYNTHTGNLKLCGDPNEKVTLYRFLNGNDENDLL